MKIAPKKILVCLLGLMSTLSVFAEKTAGGPPHPNPFKKPPTPKGTPIDSHLYLLIVVAFIFAMYIMYKNKTKNA